LATALEPILIIHDAHRPYHDKRAWRLMLKVGQALKPDHIVVNGDLFDFYKVSSHSKDPQRALSLIDEVADGNVGLDELDALNPDANKIFVEGNHCDRLRRYLADKAPELFGLTDIPTLFRLRERGWKHVPYKKHTRLGKLYITHDVDQTGRYAAYRALDMYQHSNTTGHTHRLAYIVEGNVAGEQKLSASFGWLGDVNQIDYMHEAKAKKDWALGFGIGYLEPKSGHVFLTPVPIVKYSCVVNGKLYTA